MLSKMCGRVSLLNDISMRASKVVGTIKQQGSKPDHGRYPGLYSLICSLLAHLFPILYLFTFEAQHSWENQGLRPAICGEIAYCRSVRLKVTLRETSYWVQTALFGCTDTLHTLNCFTNIHLTSKFGSHGYRPCNMICYKSDLKINVKHSNVKAWKSEVSVFVVEWKRKLEFIMNFLLVNMSATEPVSEVIPLRFLLYMHDVKPDFAARIISYQRLWVLPEEKDDFCRIQYTHLPTLLNLSTWPEVSCPFALYAGLGLCKASDQGPLSSMWNKLNPKLFQGG
ncbi:hypothetical protein C5167_014011 [Papaver somniferum]|uniref:Uncharacterized protein n=1 Tax=Papaver somniferum TaxID=3469 RepID=A0A4Y7J526_PAPSO|nr:hypothetical protein C5167_014011 [Papaver somniferum]